MCRESGGVFGFLYIASPQQGDLRLQALRHAGTPMVGLEPATDGSLQELTARYLTLMSSQAVQPALRSPGHHWESPFDPVTTLD
ncbi:hypothetical protein PoB_001755800 [Plakobranchus ocellatus]|uniref:Uncharacterized protein n=1 Tax=Plakobranchus ocellatus TaxID=259542 RepID=A0AAV3Z8I0_9GAST|nr:hypothetical protein PoB_001755800 [Plakobranchus ocellatus]